MAAPCMVLHMVWPEFQRNDDLVHPQASLIHVDNCCVLLLRLAGYLQELKVHQEKWIRANRKAQREFQEQASGRTE